MNLFESSLNTLFAPTAKRSAEQSTLGPWFDWMPRLTDSAKKVNANSSFKISAFWCGVNTISNSIALLPKRIYVDTGKKMEVVKGHPVDNLIHSKPNQMMTPVNFWAAITQSALVKGDGFARIIHDGNGDPLELVLWRYEDVTVKTDGRELFYKHADREKLYLSGEVFHIPGFGFNGVKGKNVVAYAAENLGLSLSADQFGANAYDEKGVTYGVIESDHDLGKTGKKNVRKLVKQDMAEISRHKIAVLDDGMKYKTIGLNPAESQFIMAKASGVEDIARWLNIPLFKLHTKGEGGYNFLIQMSIEYMTSAVMPWGQKIKEEIQRKLLGEKEKAAGLYCFMNYRKTMEVDPKTRTTYYKDMVLIKSMTPNEVRKKEDMNPIDGGDEVLQMANLQTQEQIDKQLQNG